MQGTPVSERAIPVAIFETNAGKVLYRLARIYLLPYTRALFAYTFGYSEIMRFYVKKWCKISSEVGIRSIIDWSYYKQRLSSAIQKIITIPAAMQKVCVICLILCKMWTFATSIT